jgi:SOS-response transcriptional repressor LexA
VTNETANKARPGRKPRRALESYDTETVHGRLKYARSRMYPSASAAARANGWVISTTTQHENGERQLTTDAAKKYAHAYEVSLDYLFLGRTTNPLNFGHIPSLPQQFTPVIDLGDIRALQKYAIEKRAMSNRKLPAPPNEGEPSSSIIFVTMPDKSMENPTDKRSIAEGEKVECDAASVWGPSDIVLSVVDGYTAGVIREYALISENPEVFELRALNPAWPAIRVDDARAGVIIAKVTGALRRF